jgi:hypothetical protein
MILGITKYMGSRYDIRGVLIFINPSGCMIIVKGLMLLTRTIPFYIPLGSLRSKSIIDEGMVLNDSLHWPR